MSEYLAKIKSLTDKVACTGAVLSNPEMTSKILAGLDLEYNLVVSALASRVEPITVQEFYSQLLSFDACLSLLHGTNLRQSSPTLSHVVADMAVVTRGKTAVEVAGVVYLRAMSLVLVVVATEAPTTATIPAAAGATTTTPAAASTTTTAAAPPQIAALVVSCAKSQAMRSWTVGTGMMKTSSPTLVMLLLPYVKKEEETASGTWTRVQQIMSPAS